MIEVDMPFFLSSFIKKRRVEPEIAQNLLKYSELVIEWNEKFNLTAKESPSAFFRDIVSDSAKFYDFIDSKKINSIADIGTGSGIPGIVLKLLKPSLKLVLVEVNKKKIGFLKHVIKFFELKDVEIVDYDWRTFTRKTSFEVDCLVSKAAFDQDEIVRMFRSTSFYKNKFMIYWASEKWFPEKHNQEYIKQNYAYSVNSKKMQLILFSKNEFDFKEFLLN